MIKFTLNIWYRNNQSNDWPEKWHILFKFFRNVQIYAVFTSKNIHIFQIVNFI